MKNKMIFISLFAALIAASRFIAVPMGFFGVPIVLQNMMAVLAGSLMGIYGAASVALFILAGILGFPVFASGQAGMAAMFSPTGGFIFGYFMASLIAGLILGQPRPSEKRNTFLVLKVITAIFFSFIIIYVFGVLRIAQIIMQAKFLTFAQSLKPAIAAGALPFLIGDLIKIILAILLTLKIRPIAARYLN